MPDEESGGSSLYWNGGVQCLMKNLEVLPRIGMGGVQCLMKNLEVLPRIGMVGCSA